MNTHRFQTVTGIHILGEIYTDAVELLRDLERAKTYISGLLNKSHLHELGSFYHQFENNQGFTGIISLVESHIAVHTWPELKYLTLDLYLCNYSKDNSALCKTIFREICNYFCPVLVKKRIVER